MGDTVGLDVGTTLNVADCVPITVGDPIGFIDGSGVGWLGVTVLRVESPSVVGSN